MAKAEKVVILGMRRSGTSLTAKLLAGIGYFFENDSRPPDKNNPEGYWESKRVQDLNSRIVRRLGGSAEVAPRAKRGWELNKGFATERTEASSIVRAYEAHLPWGMKDDRFSITLPLWKPAFSGGVSYLICVRNPLSVMKSWEAMRMRKLDLQASYESWYQYMTQAILNTEGERRLLVPYEGFKETPEELGGRIRAFLGRESEPAAESAYRAELAHHQTSMKDFLDHQEAPPKLKLLYLALYASLTGGIDLDDIGKSLRAGDASASMQGAGSRVSKFFGRRP